MTNNSVTNSSLNPSLVKEIAEMIPLVQSLSIKLADKQAALGKSQSEALTYQEKAEKLRGELDFDEMEGQRMEEARRVYVAAKEKEDKELVAAASSARLHLQSFVFRSNKSSIDLARLI